MKLNDPMANFIANKLDILNTIKNWFPEYVNNGMVVCPFHDDHNASLHISAEGKALCHGCGWKAINIIDLYAKMMEVTYMEARKQLYDEVVDAISASVYVTFWKRLVTHTKGLNYLTGRGITSLTKDQFHIGYDPHTKRITIPILDQFGSCVNIRMVAFDKSRESKHKALNTKGHGEVRLFPEWLAVKEDKLLLVEGEWDCLIGRQLGLPTVTWTGGANAWNHNYDWVFKGKNVVVLYDTDAPGRQGASTAFKMLSPVANMVVLDHIFGGDGVRGKDLNEWYLNETPKLVEFITWFDRWNPDIKQEGHVCPSCGRPL